MTIEQDINIFVELAKKCKTSDEWLEKARRITNVKPQVSGVFREYYDPFGELSIKEVSDLFFNDVKNGTVTAAIIAY